MISNRILSSVYNLRYPKEDLDKLDLFLNLVKNKLIHTDIDIYLFGSYAKGRIKDTSDFDIALISKVNGEIKDLHKIKIEIILEVDEKLNLQYGDDFDIKIYTKDRFEECLKKGSFFETTINSYMYKVE